MVAIALLESVGCALLFQFCNKKIIHEELPSTVISFMYVGCALIASGFAFFLGKFDIQWSIFLMGIVNAVGAWSFLRALNQGLAKTILFLPLTRIVALIAAAIFLSEWKFFDPHTLAGFLTFVGTLTTLFSVLFFGKTSTNKSTTGRKWIFNLAGFVLVTGLVDFLTKYFAHAGVPLSQYILSWYWGALVGSCLPRFFEKNKKITMRFDQVIWYLGTSIGTMGSLAGIYWALEFAPAALVFPVHAFGYATGSVLMGLFIFHERKNFGVKEWLGMLLGAIGTILIIVGIY